VRTYYMIAVRLLRMNS